MATIRQDVSGINNPMNHALANVNPEKWDPEKWDKKTIKSIMGKLVKVGYVDAEPVWGIAVQTRYDRYPEFLNLESMEVKDIDSPGQVMDVRNFDWKVLLNV